MQKNRLQSGGRIDRTQVLNFRFNGRAYQGCAGDTLASALLANGVYLIGRSFKLHRPRGIVGSGAEEPNAIVQIGSGAATLPNQCATQVLLYEGLDANSLRGWPSVQFDVGSITNWFSRFLAAGFYYKTFMAPRKLWSFYEKLIRDSAGWGHAPTKADPDFYEHRNAHCDVLIAGAGPAGLMAALAAANSGARVIIADEQSEFGGRLLSQTDEIDSMAATDWVAQAINTLAQHENVRMLPRSTVFGYFDHNFVTIAEHCTDHLGAHKHTTVRERLWRVRARQVILAQGAFERPLVFCNNDRPGVMLASAVSTYVNRYGVCPGREVVVFANNDSAYRCALDLDAAGASVKAVIDSRATGAGDLQQEVEALGITVMTGHVVTNTLGSQQIRAVQIAKFSIEGTVPATLPAQDLVTIQCDLLAMSGGWSPAVHLHSQSGGRITWSEELHCFVPDGTTQNCVSAGAGNGAWELHDCLRQGLEAGKAAIEYCGLEISDLAEPKTEGIETNSLQPLWRVPAVKAPDRCPKQFLDFQNDTSVADVRLAVREGYRNVEHVKRYTALGFGTDQGKLGNINGMAVLAEYLGEPIANVGTTTFRPAYTPTSFGTCAGETVGQLFDPVRKTAIHEWHEAAGAKFETVGQWLRPWYFPDGDEDLDAAVKRECLATRRSVGIMDASTLGKIDVQGPDAVKFLERIYTHDVGKMKVGRCAYGIMLGEDGMLKDDGVMARLGEQHFYLTTTTGGAASVMSWLELWLQTEWPDLDVYLTSVTDHYSTISVAGPTSRQLLQAIDCDTSLDAADFPFMSTQTATLCNLPVRLFRVSFSGELAFEINVASDHALTLWCALMDAGKNFDITPYGTESMHVLRAEKGFVIVGQDTDGSVTPTDLHMSWMLASDKDFLGKRSLRRPDALRADRKQWVGLIPADKTTVIAEGTQLIEDTAARAPVPMCGHISSSYDSPTLGHPIALALLKGGLERAGEKVYASLANGKAVPMTVTSPVFYDPQGERQRD